MLADDKSSSFFCHLIISSVFLFLFLFFFSGRNLGSSCPLGTFRCLANDSEIGVCLPRRLLCDNRPDCPDGSDEDPLKCCEFLFICVRFFPIDQLCGSCSQTYPCHFGAEMGAINRSPCSCCIASKLLFFIFSILSCRQFPLPAVPFTHRWWNLFFFFFLSFSMRIIADNYGELQSFVNVVSENPAPESTTVPATVSPFFANCCELSVDIHQKSRLFIFFFFYFFFMERQLPRPTREVAHVKIVRGFSASIWIWCWCLKWKPVSLDCTSLSFKNWFLPFFISFTWSSVYQTRKHGTKIRLRKKTTKQKRRIITTLFPFVLHS